ncbi:hypothetical protein ACIOHS_39560 [Streptomyces sp. NPDC088253]
MSCRDRKPAALVTRFPEITERHGAVQALQVETARHILGRAQH